MNYVNFFVPMALSIIFQVLKLVIKNPSAKEEMKAACLKLRDSINAAYADDPDFGVQS
jgi:hypothetical protein